MKSFYVIQFEDGSVIVSDYKIAFGINVGLHAFSCSSKGPFYNEYFQLNDDGILEKPEPISSDFKFETLDDAKKFITSNAHRFPYPCEVYRFEEHSLNLSIGSTHISSEKVYFSDTTPAFKWDPDSSLG